MVQLFTAWNLSFCSSPILYAVQLDKHNSSNCTL